MSAFYQKANKLSRDKKSSYKRYYPKRPVKSFQDLQVYQILYNNSVKIIKRCAAERPAAEVDTDVSKARDQSQEGTECQKTSSISALGSSITKKLTDCVLKIPLQIATAHSIRFSEQQKALLILEKVMLNCNLAVVYLEQYRDLCNKEIEVEFFDELIKSYLTTRSKVFRLQRAWIKFMRPNEKIKEK